MWNRGGNRRTSRVCVIVNSPNLHVFWRRRGNRADSRRSNLDSWKSANSRMALVSATLYALSPRRNSNDKMAPRRKSVQTSRRSLNDICYKENNYLCCLNDYQTRVRRRESLRYARSHAVSSSRRIVHRQRARDRHVRWLTFKNHSASCLVEIFLAWGTRRFDRRRLGPRQVRCSSKRCESARDTNEL